jgi:hypothetical protein
MCWLKNLDTLKCGGWRVFIAPTTKVAVGEAVCRRAHRTVRCATGHCPVRHRTLSGVPATSPNRWGSTIGALTSGATGQSGGAPDSSCPLSGVPSGACSDSVRVVCALFTHCSLLQTTVGAVSRCSAWHTGQSGATPDSPVNYSGVAFPETRRWQVRS